MPKITVYIPSHNYGRYLDQSIQSVLRQTSSDWELIVIDDGSTDDTADVVRKYKGDPRIRIVEQENKGLNVTNNIALRLARGEYMVRLDADDFFDENALLVLSHTLDSKPGIGLVYPDYFMVDDTGAVLEIVRRKKIGDEVTLLDLPAHGACTMIRRQVLEDLGGYYEEFNRQDGYGLWLRFIQRYKPYNVNVPLFYYRQHPGSLTQDGSKLLEVRRAVKQKFIDDEKMTRPSVLAIVPVLGGRRTQAVAGPFTELGGKSLLAHTLDELVRAQSLAEIVVSHTDDEVGEFAASRGVRALKRSAAAAAATARVEDTAREVLDSLPVGAQPEALCLCYLNTPFRRAEHVDKAVDTMTIFGVDSVVSVQNELSFCYQHREHGLMPINGAHERQLRLERDAIYRENGAIFLTRADVIRSGRLLGRTIGHIMMQADESVKINTRFDLWLAEQIAGGWHQHQAGVTRAVSS